MKLRQLILWSFLAFWILPTVAQGQAWSGIISPSRATDWSRAGVVGGIPSASWTQCGSTIAAGASASTINSAIASCGSNQYVLLGAGTFNLSGAITFNGKNNVALRGSGANATFLVFSNGVVNSCGGYGGEICLGNGGAQYWGGYSNIGWSSGYAQGTSTITLGSTSGITVNSTILVLNQCDDGKSGSSCSGSSTDTGNLFNCSDTYNGSSGCSFNGPDGGNGTSERYQQEMFYVTNISGNNVTLDHPLRFPNWSSARSPQAWTIQPAQFEGVENLSIDSTSNTSGAGSAVMMWSTMNCWVSGVRFVKSPQTHVYVLNSAHDTIESNYFALSNVAPTGDQIAFRFTVAADNLVDNNIAHQIRNAYMCEGPCVGNVIAYNYMINDAWSSENALFQSMRPHSGGNAYELDEGNVAMNIYWENYHGTQNFETAYRNLLQGWYSNPAAPKNYQANALMVDTYNRYNNAIANVLGTPGVQTSYQQTSGDPHTNPIVVYALGLGNGAVSPAVPSDPMGSSTFLRWGNYDVVTGGVRWCGNSSNSTFASLCDAVAEVPLSAPLFPNSVPSKGDTAAGQPAFPASFYRSSAPAWWGSNPWPAIGPDVSGGNVGICSGAINTSGHYSGEAALSNSQCTGTSLTASAWGGHVNAIPAMACALNVMGMPPDGSGGVLSFNAKTCYGTTTSSNTPAPPSTTVAPPTNLNVVIK